MPSMGTDRGAHAVRTAELAAAWADRGREGAVMVRDLRQLAPFERRCVGWLVRAYAAAPPLANADPSYLSRTQLQTNSLSLMMRYCLIEPDDEILPCIVC